MSRRTEGAIRPAAAVSGLLVLLAWTTTFAPAGRAQEAADRQPGVIVGRVLQGAGEPASGVRVVAVGAGFAETTGRDGRFRIEPAAAGVHRLILVHPEFGTDSARAAVASGTTTGLTLRYGAGGRLSRTLHLGGLPADAAGESGTGRPTAGAARILGRLIDRETSDPIPSASVRLPSLGRQAETSGDGRFAFDSLPPGSYTLRVDHVRYGKQTARVEVPDGRTVDAELRLAPRALEVEPIEVTVDVRSPGLSDAGFYERREWARKQGYGHFFDAGDLEERGNRISQVLGTVPRLSIGQFGGQLSGAGNVPYFPRYRDFSGQCLPAIYLDGTKVIGSGPARSVAGQFGPRGVDAFANLADVAGIEVYESPSGTAAEFQGSDSGCGVIAIWTKRGRS